MFIQAAEFEELRIARDVNLANVRFSEEYNDGVRIIKPFEDNIMAFARPKRFVIETSPFSMTCRTAQNWNIQNQKGLEELELLCSNIDMTQQMLHEITTRLQDIRGLAFCVPVQREILDGLLEQMPPKIRSLTLKSRTANKKERKLAPQG